MRGALLVVSCLIAAVTAYERTTTSVSDRDRVATSALQPALPSIVSEPSESSPLPPTAVVVRDSDSIPELMPEGSDVRAPAANDDPPQIPPERSPEDRLADLEQAMLDVTNGEAEVLPELEGEELVGLRVSAIQEGSRLTQVGIEEDDVITEFNGIAIDSPFLALHAAREMFEPGAYRVMVRRGDAMMQLDGASDGAGG